MGGGEKDGVWMDQEPSCGRYKRSSHRIEQVETWAGEVSGRKKTIDAREGCGHDARLTCAATSCPDLIAFLPPPAAENFVVGAEEISAPPGRIFCGVRYARWGSPGQSMARRELTNWCGAGDGDGDATGMYVC